jgi:hypothetical protein
MTYWVNLTEGAGGTVTGDGKVNFKVMFTDSETGASETIQDCEEALFANGTFAASE